MLIQIADGRGIEHRDLKPASVYRLCARDYTPQPLQSSTPFAGHFELPSSLLGLPAAPPVLLNCLLQIEFGLSNALRTLVVVGVALSLDERNRHQHSRHQDCNN
ncbi:MAG TPA: hypothetical protein VII81_11650 [Terriglobales bacterium]